MMANVGKQLPTSLTLSFAKGHDEDGGWEDSQRTRHVASSVPTVLPESDRRRILVRTEMRSCVLQDK